MRKTEERDCVKNVNVVSDMEYITKEAVQKCLDDLSSENLIGNENDTFISLAEAKDRIEELPTADVAPKSEVESVLNEIEKIIRGALILVGVSYKHNPKETQCKKECYEDFLGYIAELKKKYTEEKT